MKLVTIDFETFWSTEHTLSKMSPIAYVMHPETEIISMSMAVGNEPATVVFGEDAARKLLAPHVDDALLVGHNMSGFDSMIVAWRLGLRPRMWGCTLAMARPIHAKEAGGSLAKLVAHYNLGVKDNTALVQTKGKHLKDFTAQERAAMAQYNRADTEQCRELFNILKAHYTAKELWHVDATVRMLVDPVFELDAGLLAQTLAEERRRKKESLLYLSSWLGKGQVGTDDELIERVREELASAQKFSTLLTSLKVPVPLKPSPTNPEKEVPALAKTDEAFIALTEHPDELVAMAARARLDVKSTLLETRIGSFLDAGKAIKGKLPVPLRYCGADTTGRWSGEQYNPQNLPRIPRDKEGNIIPKPGNALRMSMLAPLGYKVVVADLSGIELRVNHFLWQVQSSMHLFRQDPAKADLYKDFASSLYNVALVVVTTDQRQVGKVAHLGLGFGAGAGTFKKVARLMAGIDLDDGECINIVGRWREDYADIVEGWKTCHRMLPYILTGDEVEIDPWGLTKTCAEGIRLPSGRIIRYPELVKERTGDRWEWSYGRGRNKSRIYAGKIDENIVQALARDVIADCAFDFWKATKLRPALMVHDELVYVVPNSGAQGALDELQGIMRTPPKWWPELITWSEGDIADSYGEAK